MLTPTFNLKQFADDTDIILNKWDPRVSNKSQLQRASDGSLSITAGALQRTPDTQSGGTFFDIEKKIFIQSLDDFMKLINFRSNAINKREIRTVSDHFNQSNAMQGLIRITLSYQKLYEEKAKHLRKAENKARTKRSYQHLTIDAAQNQRIRDLLSSFKLLVGILRHTQELMLTSRGEYAGLLEDALDQSTFELGQNILAYVPYHDASLSHYLQNPAVNPLINGLRLKILLNQQVRHVTLCPSWPSNNDAFPLMGPTLYFKCFFNAPPPQDTVKPSPQGNIQFENLTLSVLMNFDKNDDVASILPAVQVMLEIAQLHQYSRVVFHAPEGCAEMLYALGFRSNDKDMRMPDLHTQDLAVKALFLAGKPIVYDATKPLINTDSLDEKFMHDLDLRCFYFEMKNLESKLVCAPLATELQSWAALLRSKRYLNRDCLPGVIPEFSSLPYLRFTPSFDAILKREHTGRMPLTSTRYIESTANVGDVVNDKVLQSIGAMAISFKAIEQVEQVKSGTVVKLK